MKSFDSILTESFLGESTKYDRKKPKLMGNKKLWGFIPYPGLYVYSGMGGGDYYNKSGVVEELDPSEASDQAKKEGVKFVRIDVNDLYNITDKIQGKRLGYLIFPSALKDTMFFSNTIKRGMEIWFGNKKTDTGKIRFFK